MEVALGDQVQSFEVPVPVPEPRARAIHWKAFYSLVSRRMAAFETISDSTNFFNLICMSEGREEVRCSCRLRADLLADPGRQVYLEMDVLANADSVTLAVIDINSDGMSFDPDSGFVDRFVDKGGRACINLLPEMHGPPFHGRMGLLVSGGHLAFFRRSGRGAWQTTGFVTELQWFHGQVLSVCLQFGDEGHYCVKITSIGSGDPPVTPTMSEALYH